ncbi:MAG: hypothetical protein INR69_18500, partial [Mucilaginibacter polytrichastri]|nr:hypothetical protein [Mucilaginibacter polytrichastri]
MIRILYKGEYLDLAPGEKITVDWVSTVFNDENSFQGSMAYDVQVALSPKNNRLLEHADKVENRSSRKDIQVVLEIFGQSWKRCTATFNKGAKAYRFSLKIDNGEIGKALQE